MLERNNIDELNELEQPQSSDTTISTTTSSTNTLFQGYGTHYLDLYVGSPIAQKQTVIVDTGSSLTAFPCQDCNECGESYVRFICSDILLFVAIHIYIYLCIIIGRFTDTYSNLTSSSFCDDNNNNNNNNNIL